MIKSEFKSKLSFFWLLQTIIIAASSIFMYSLVIFVIFMMITGRFDLNVELIFQIIFVIVPIMLFTQKLKWDIQHYQKVTITNQGILLEGWNKSNYLAWEEVSKVNTYIKKEKLDLDFGSNTRGAVAKIINFQREEKLLNYSCYANKAQLQKTLIQIKKQIHRNQAIQINQIS